MTLSSDNSEQFIKMLIEDGLISQAHLQQAQSIQATHGGRLIEILLGICRISETKLYQAIARKLNMPFWSEHELQKFNLDVSIIQRFPMDTVSQYNFLPFKWEQQENYSALHLVISDPYAQDLLEHIRRYAEVSALQVGVATPSAISTAIQIHYRNQSHMSPPEDPPYLGPEDDRVLNVNQTSHNIAPPKLPMRECPACENSLPIHIEICTRCSSPMDLSQADPLLNKYVGGGKVCLTRKLGEGGMGLVYQAYDEENNIDVAVKILRIHLSTNDRVIKRFHREAQAQSILRHDNIVHVHDFGFAEGIGYYLAMEFLRGQSMEEILEHKPHLLTVSFTRSVLSQVCDAMGFAHSRGIYHRDLKPDNIFLLEQDNWEQATEQKVKVLDFGVAKMMVSDNDDRLTRTGMTIGTPRYMAPEQAGEGTSDHRSDIYSLGIILFEILTGKSPFDDTSAYQIMLKHVYAEPPSLQSIRPDIPYPPDLENFVYRVMSKNPHHRPQSMDMFWQELAPSLDLLERSIGPNLSLHDQMRGAFRISREEVEENHTNEPPVIVGRMLNTNTAQADAEWLDQAISNNDVVHLQTEDNIQPPARNQMIPDPQHIPSPSKPSILAAEDLAHWEDSFSDNISPSSPSYSAMHGVSSSQSILPQYLDPSDPELQAAKSKQVKSEQVPRYFTPAPKSHPPGSSSLPLTPLPHQGYDPVIQTPYRQTGDQAAYNANEPDQKIPPIDFSEHKHPRIGHLGLRSNLKNIREKKAIQPRALKQQPSQSSKRNWLLLILFLALAAGIALWILWLQPMIQVRTSSLPLHNLTQNYAQKLTPPFGQITTNSGFTRSGDFDVSVLMESKP